MRFQILLVSGALLALSSSAFAADYGKVGWAGKTANMSNAYAFVRPGGDGAEQFTVIVLSEKPLKASNQVEDRQYDDRREGMAEGMLGDGSPLSVVLNIDAKGKLDDIAVFAGSSTRRDGNEHNLRLSRRDAGRIEGTVGTPDVDKAGGINLDLQFALDVQGVPDFGPALPADGGAPFNAYQAYVMAVLAGKPDAVAKTMTHDDAEDLLGMNKRYNDVHAAEKKIKGMQFHTLHDSKFVSGNSKDDDARIVVTGVLVRESGGNKKATRTASQSLMKLKRENGQWRVISD